MKRPVYFLLLSIFMLACSLTTPPALPDIKAKSVDKISLATPTMTPSAAPSKIPTVCTVSAQSLHLRDCAGLTCTVIAWLSQGEQLDVQEKDSDWVKVTTPAGQIGWVHSKYCGGLP
jgi:uncharacterized protein YgiM (DUF1202 family)